MTQMPVLNEITNRTCVRRDSDFVVDTSRRGWWSRKFCTDECKTLGWSTYTPDFFLSDTNRWIEVKGGWTDRARRKFDEFNRTHDAFVVLAKDILKFDDYISHGMGRSLPYMEEVV